MSKRAQRRQRAADATCQALRAAWGKPVSEATRADWDLVGKYLSRWMRNAGKMKYELPKR